MRHLALDLKLEYPLSHSHGRIELAHALSEKIDGYKFNGFVKIVVISYSQEQQNCFSISEAISRLIECAIESVQHVISLNIRTHRDCWEMVKIDIVEVAE